MSVNNFLALILTVTQLASVIPLATGDEVIKFWKVKDQGQWGRYVWILWSLSNFLDALQHYTFKTLHRKTRTV